jgi:regulatory protein YycI of two-component signal transduction system YycFG
MDQSDKSKYIVIGLVVILLTITVVAVQQLFQSKMSNDLLKLTNDRITEEQLRSDNIIKEQQDSIISYNKELIKVNNRRKVRKDNIIASEDMKPKAGIVSKVNDELNENNFDK